MYQQERFSRVQETTPNARFSLSERVARPRAGCCSFLMLLAGLLAGLLVGALGTFLFISSAHDASAPTSQSVPGQTTAIVIQLTPTYLSQVITKEISSASIPGNLTNIQVTMAPNTPITISGNEQVNVLGFAVTRPVTVQLQPVVRACQIQIGITHADFSGISVTSFVSPLEQQINQQLSSKQSGSLFSKGFVYCATDVHTETNGIFVTYSARPL
jgi:hypothetical protein